MSTRNWVRFPFERSVNPEGSETNIIITAWSDMFERSVNPEGSETNIIITAWSDMFERSVNPEGSETNRAGIKESSLR